MLAFNDNAFNSGERNVCNLFYHSIHTGPGGPSVTDQ